MSRNIDAIDRRILDELERDGRLSIVELSERVNLTNTPCSERVKRLERSGYISGYRANLNMEMLGLGAGTIHWMRSTLQSHMYLKSKVA